MQGTSEPGSSIRRFRSAPAHGIGLKADAHHATVNVTQTRAAAHVTGMDRLPRRIVHIIRNSSGGTTYSRLDSAAAISAPPIASSDQRGGLNCNAMNKQPMPITHANRNAPAIRLVVFCM